MAHSNIETKLKTAARLWFVVVNLMLLAPAIGQAQDMGVTDESNSLGNVAFPTSCVPDVQADFERGVAFLHHMMYVEARKTFEAVAQADASCAMAHWGRAMTMFQPLWPTRPGPEELSAGWDAVTEAKSLNPTMSIEQDFIAAVESFYQQTEGLNYQTRIKNFEQGMMRVYEANPTDKEAAAFYALSLLSTAGQSDDRPAQQAKAADLLLKIHAQEPKHPGAVHYTIHANDMDGRERVSLDVVRSYNEIAPSVPHALHMPTHIFVRLGEWQDVIDWNDRSAEAALNFPAGDATSHHYLHALDYQVYAHMQRAEDMKAEAIVASLAEDMNFQQSFISAFGLAAMPARYAVERRAWDEAAMLADPNPQTFPVKRFPWPMSMTEFARGLGGARTGNMEIVETSLSRLAALETQAEEAGEAYFAKQIEVSRMTVGAWQAFAKGNNEAALEKMTAAAELEATMQKHPVSPGAIQPAYELLGDMYAEVGRPEDAMRAYQTSLESWPGRFNSLLGSARTAAAMGDDQMATSYYAELMKLVTADSAPRPAIEEARSYLGDG